MPSKSGYSGHVGGNKTPNKAGNSKVGGSSNINTPVAATKSRYPKAKTTQVTHG